MQAIFSKIELEYIIFLQGRRKIDNWLEGGGGGASIHIFVFTKYENNFIYLKVKITISKGTN